MLMLQRYVEEGARTPWGYGLAWWDFMRNGWIAYPVPLNFAARWLRDLWWWLAKWRPSVVEARDHALWMAARARYDEREAGVIAAAYRRGFDDGLRTRDHLRPPEALMGRGAENES